MSSESNRRTAPRVPRHIMVRYRGESERAWKITTLRDFSLGGARLFCDQGYDVSSKLLLQFGLPIFDPPVTIECTVRWVTPLSGAFQTVMHGVAFSELEASVRQRIAQALEKELHAQAKMVFGAAEDGTLGEAKASKRRSIRAEKNFSVHVRSEGGKDWRIATLRDISLGGAQLYAQEHYEKDKPIELKIGMPLFAEPVVLSAHVVRAEAAFKGSMEIKTYGIAFDVLPSEVRQVLSQRIESDVKRTLRAKPSDEKAQAAPAQASPVVKRLNVRYRAQGERGWKSSYLKEFSVSGAELVAEGVFGQGDPIEIEMYLPQTDETVVFKACVDWREGGVVERKGSLQRFGISFIFDSQRQEENLVRAVACLLAAQR